jgi:hypothetical protein
VVALSNGFGIFILKLRRYIMKNMILALLFVLGFSSFSFAGDCSNGTCRASFQPVRKVVTVTKNVILSPVRAVAVVAAPKSYRETVVSSTDACNCAPVCECASTSTKEVVKYQPLRRRLINRTTNVNRVCQ